ncbi:histidine--tRNA ligase [Ahrensia sp. 13_GOM-1096m]|uniref:histidine--tRNA ligase n=1 Tax=Ahrensia sp. 13_GOM-1096m TaxID=1380380 RepID=UPI00047996AB|nr:histidine--tRNA ligase [Ahrensia sp. 13_GOM-1096m]
MADKKKKKPQKLKARSPRGFVDRSAADIRATDEMIGKIREVYERYGFDPVETPAFEYTDCLGKFLPDTDRPNAGVFSVQDDDEQWMSLRYDLTAPLARHVAENINEITLPYRTYRNGWVFRNEKPGPGRFRQFMQFDADTVGAPGVQADAEMCMMMADTMEALGIARGDYVIRVNNRKVLDGVMEAIGLGGDENAERRLTVLRSIDKLDKFGIEGVRQLLGKGRKDDSGDFTEGAGLDEEQIKKLSLVIDLNAFYSPEGYKSHADHHDYFTDVPTTIDKHGDDARDYHFFNALRNWAVHIGVGKNGLSGIDELFQIALISEINGYDEDRIRIDPTCVRGLEYYTGPVYEAELLFDVTNEKGEKVQFGSVGGGGRYDGLVKRFTGQDVPATGFSIGVSRLMTALKNLGKLGQDDVLAPVLVTVMDKDTESLGAYQKMVQDLRGAGIRAEMYQGNPKDFSKQMRYADKRGCPIVIIQGNDERQSGKVQLKDMIEGKRQAAAIESNEEYRAARPGQFEIEAGALVDEVKKLLAAQK